MPTSPPVESVVHVRLPVILLVPFIESPPDVFAISPLEVNCVQVTTPSVEVPVTLKPLVEVSPADVKVPVIVAFPEVTLKPLDEVTPLQTSAFVVSNVMPYCPAFNPDKAMVPIRGEIA